MAIIKAGIYVADKDIYIGDIRKGIHNIRFISNKDDYNYIYIQETDEAYAMYYGLDGDEVLVYDYNDEDGYFWTNANYRTVTLETDQEVTDELANWFEYGFEEYIPIFSIFDPTTLNLAPGTYSITITSVSKDGVESLATAPITYTAKTKLSTPTIEIEGDTLKLYGDEGTTSFKILIDGVVKEAVGVSNFTLSDGSTLTTSDGQTLNVMEE